MYFILFKSSIKPFISGVLKYPIILIGNDSGILGCTCKARIVFFHLTT